MSISELRKKKTHKVRTAIIVVFSLLAVVYALAAFTPCPYLSDARVLWIETAMTTGDHQWLAKIFPQFVIDSVMDKQVSQIDGIAGLDSVQVKDPMYCPLNKRIDDDIQSFIEQQRKEEIERAYQEKLQKEEEERLKDPLYQAKISETGVDSVGNPVIINDIEQGIVVSKIQTSSYTAFLAQVFDPSRVFVATTAQKGTQGKLICDYLSDENAIIGINASGFADYNGVGNGGTILGKTIAKGEVWGEYVEQSTIGFDKQNRLLAGSIPDWNSFGLRDAIQFGPVLLKDGNIITEGSAGWGLQPRTIIAQRSDGSVLFLVVDGRQVGYSIGATMGDCAELLKKYGAVTAAACDGGSSSVMAYSSQGILNSPSTPMETGRYLPNVFLIKRK